MPERKLYNKLIRDKIPEIIEADGRTCGIEVMSEQEYRQALKTKLIEEAQEVIEASGDDLIKELADVLEVIDGIMASYGIDSETVALKQKQRRDERGGFVKRLKLLWTE